ncbi:hypothetical protein OIV83_001204 [Microbotryomycetes sp. JL201]|nr:hypothetical protein OIV83_001204 [Microbotryomycetes sp. JL201]
MATIDLSQSVSSSPAPGKGKLAPNCPFSPPKKRRSRDSSSKRRLTELPDLRRTPSAELLYLPPLLSLLPFQAEPSIEGSGAVKVGYTLSRLPDVDNASIALHRALHELKPLTSNYAHEPYEEAFNWNELRLPAEFEREWYIVAFRSTRAPDSPSRDLYEADRQAHEEAVAAGGLLAYWYGKPSDAGSNLATCIWMSRAHAVKATAGRKHIEAMRLATSMYANYDLERYVLQKLKGEQHVTVVPWTGGEVHIP